MIKFAKTTKYKSGFKRGEHTLKPRFTLIPHSSLERLAMHYTLGGIKYGFNNWKLAHTDEELQDLKDSAVRHVLQWAKGDKDEEHFASACWNMFNYEYLYAQKKLTKKKKGV